MNQELSFETRQNQRVVRADALHACLGVATDLRVWVAMHTAAGNAEVGVEVFHDGSPESACWSLAFAAEVALLECAPELAEQLQRLAVMPRPFLA